MNLTSWQTRPGQKLPEPPGLLTEEDKSLIRQTKFIDGPAAAAVLQQQLEEKRRTEAQRKETLTGIEGIEQKLKESSMAKQDISRLREKMSLATPMEEERAFSSGPLMEHLGLLKEKAQPEKTLLAQGRTELASKGLLKQPEAESYFQTKELLKRREGMEELAGMIPKEEGFRKKAFEIFSETSDDPQTYEQIKNLIDDYEARGVATTEYEREKELQTQSETAAQKRADTVGSRYEDKLSFSTEFEKTKPLMKQIGALEKEKVYLINSNRDKLNNVIDRVKELEPGHLSGLIRAMQNPEKSGRWLTTPELQSLFTDYTMFYQSILKQTQGSRPSDYDALIFEMATGKRAITKANMLAALKAMENFLDTDSVNFINTVSYGYELPKEKVLSVLSPRVKKRYNELAGKSEIPGVAQGKAPPVGTIEDGYRFKGGDPADPNNWEKVE